MAYIDREKFAEKICNFPAIDEDAANAVIFLLHRQPTADVVEVVRCGNCLNRIKGTYPKCQGRKPDDYCSDGIRKEHE